MSATTPPKKTNCWLYGCVGLGLFTLVGIVATVFIVRSVFLKALDNYTSTEPLAMERVVLPPDEMTNLMQRVTRFREALDKGDQEEELLLDANEINALIGQNKDLADKVLIRIDDDKLTGQVSLPLGFIGLDDRYFNGEATFQVRIVEGRLQIHIAQAAVNGENIPEMVIKELSQQNLAQEIKDPELEKAIAKFESIEIKDGRLICRTRVATDSPDQPVTPVEEPNTIP